MRQSATLLLAICLAVMLSRPARADDCSASVEHHAFAVSGEVAGARQFAADLGHGLTFVLSPALHGWDIDILDPHGTNLALGNPPQHGDTNTRQLYGWHFRNAANTGPNEGDINAPQRQRRFVLGDPSADRIGSAGLGWLSIEDLGLADLDPGERARMVYLRFNACIMTPKSENEQAREAYATDPVYINEEMELIRTCGLELAYRPEAWVLPRMLNGDFDADDAHDFAVPIVREADGQHGIAICRAGTWTSIHGMDDGPPGSDLSPGYFNQIEAWAVGPRDALPRYVGDPGLPAGPGDVITIERIEKSAYSLYWAGAGFRSHHHYTLVEP
ncbi:hypothetical protein [uncultured Maricaulis sp.]|uniref:hypothetical protein n=1 Tax=uncultured Maricaulis sp. TaxID=174710 RepID=UPI00262A412B|nr:hypothetical protein [uncultured Maricaulis sp.]